MLNVSPNEPSRPEILPSLPPEQPADVDAAAAPPDAPQQRSLPKRRFRLNTAACFAVAILAFVLAYVAAGFRAEQLVVLFALTGIVVFFATALLAAWRVLVGLAALVLPELRQPNEDIGMTLAALFGNLVMAGLGT